jgi:hypothetical protein
MNTAHTYHMAPLFLFSALLKMLKCCCSSSSLLLSLIFFIFLFEISMLSDWVSFLAYPNLFGIKGFVVVENAKRRTYSENHSNGLSSE